MATEICPNEGKLYLGTSFISSRTVYHGLLFSKTIGAASITASSTLATLGTEETGAGSGGTAYARQSASLGAMDSTGTLTVPSVTWNPGNATDWHNNVAARFIASAASGGVFIYVWDLAATRDMSKANANLVVPAVSFFYKNPGE